MEYKTDMEIIFILCFAERGRNEEKKKCKVGL